MLEVLLEEDDDGFNSRKEKEGREERGQDRTGQSIIGGEILAQL